MIRFVFSHLSHTELSRIVEKVLVLVVERSAERTWKVSGVNSVKEDCKEWQTRQGDWKHWGQHT